MEHRKFSRICAEIDLNALDRNMEIIEGRLAPGASVCAVVKADAYGHGAIQIAKRLEPNPRVWGFACATSSEAVVLRKAGISKPVILLGYSFEESYEEIFDYHLRPCVFDSESASGLSEMAVSRGETLPVHLAVDTGMGRIGFAPDEASARTAAEIASLPGITVEGLFTHFARADEPDRSPVDLQFGKYISFRQYLNDFGVRIPVSHAGNSAAIMRFPDTHLDMTRAGIILYGLMPSDDVADEMRGLQPVMRLVSHVSYVKTLPAGHPVSYGGTFTADRPVRIATVPVGYADGYPRQLSNRGTVLIGGKRVPITGRVCMDQLMVDVSGLPDVKRGDEVVLLGAQGDERITAEELGRISGRFNYELVCCVSRRVPRSYLDGGRVVEQVDYFM